MVTKCGIDANKTLLANFYAARYNYMRCDKCVVVNYRMVAYVVATPERYVVANLYKGLDSVVFKNETVFTDLVFV